MITRYTLPEMGKLWSSHYRYQCWLEVELAACKAMNVMGVIPAEDWEQISAKADFNAERIEDIETVTKHDVIAFLTNVAEYVGPSPLDPLWHDIFRCVGYCHSSSTEACRELILTV